MEDSLLYVFSTIFTSFLVVLIFKTLLHRNKRTLNLPPSPPGLPFIGHLHLLKEPVHRALQSISQQYGPVVYLNFGSRPVVVISSPSAVEECFTKNDIVLANRPRLLMGEYLSYNFNILITAPYGDHWRNLRKISSLEMLSLQRLSMSAGIRRDEILQMLRQLYQSSSEGYAKVELRTVFSNLTFNIILRMLVGKRCYDEGAVHFEETLQFTETIKEVLEFAGTSYLGDYVSLLRWIDYGGYVKRCKRLAEKVDAFFQGLIDEHKRDFSKVKEEETVIHRLLCLQKSEPEYYTDETIKGLILVLLMAGTDTSAVTSEWAMSLLLNHPNVLDKAKSEIDIQAGEDHLVDESDLPKLQCLQNIFSETLRMFPSVPLLLPHLSSQDCQIGGFDIPCGTMVLVNAWGIHRDPNLWNEPLEFKPDRFATSDPDQYRLLPFGLGRRGCPGATLGNRMVTLALGSLIQSFDWKKVNDEIVDLTEGRGLNMPRAQALEAMCKARPILSKFL